MSGTWGLHIILISAFSLGFGADLLQIQTLERQLCWRTDRFVSTAKRIFLKKKKKVGGNGRRLYDKTQHNSVKVWISGF